MVQIILDGQMEIFRSPDKADELCVEPEEISEKRISLTREIEVRVVKQLKQCSFNFNLLIPI